MNHCFIDRHIVGICCVIFAAIVDKQHLIRNGAKSERLQSLRLSLAVIQVDCIVNITLLAFFARFVFLGHLLDDLYSCLDGGRGLGSKLLFF